MGETSRTCGVQASDARFVAGVLRDAKKLDWGEGQLNRRKRAIESAMSKYVAKKLGQEDNLFQRHGWNEVDSGFRLWGAGKIVGHTGDNFLQSKGWNDIDSSFRVF